MWPDRRILDLFGIELPILQAPMAGAQRAELAIAVSEAGGLGALGCAILGPEEVRAEMSTIRQRTTRPVNLNFFCHPPPVADPQREAAWLDLLAPFYAEFGLPPPAPPPADAPAGSFDEVHCALVEEMLPPVVSFHFGLPPRPLLARVRATGARIIATATTVAEARVLEAEGCHAVIAQGSEAGGHRGTFLGSDPASQLGTFALVPQVADAVGIPVIAAGGIADGRGIAAAFALGAAAVQIGTAYLRTPESAIGPLHRQALRGALDDSTALANVFTGRAARALRNRLVDAVGPLAPAAPDFPRVVPTVAALRAAAEAAGSGDFSPLWAGQAAPLTRELPARELTRAWAEEAASVLARLGGIGA